MPSHSDFRDVLDELEALARFAPEIIEAIEKDLDRNAREKKSLRLADKKFFESRTDDLPTMNITERFGERELGQPCDAGIDFRQTDRADSWGGAGRFQETFVALLAKHFDGAALPICLFYSNMEERVRFERCAPLTKVRRNLRSPTACFAPATA